MNKEARNRSIDFFNQAMALVKTDPQMAYRLLCSATTVDPTMAQAWYMLGNSCADLKMLPASIAAFRRCLELDKGDEPGDHTEDLHAKALVNIAHRLQQNGQLEEAYEENLQAIWFLESHPEADQEGRAFCYTNMSLILSLQGETADGLEYAKKGFELSQAAIVETGLGFAYLFDGDYANGLKHFGARFAYNGTFQNLPYAKWNGEKVKTLLIACDAGIGDTISFARFVPACLEFADKVIWQVQSEVLGMMTEAMQWDRLEIIPHDSTMPSADAWVPVMDVPVALRLDNRRIKQYPQMWDVPPAKPGMSLAWKVPDRKLHIGIAYAGNPINEVDRHRSIPVQKFLDLYRAPDIQLYSLQVGERVKDLHEAGAVALIRDMSPWIRDASDTAAIMRELDLIITIDSFVSHLAGAMGKSTWTLVSKLGGDFRLGRKGEVPLWYANHTLFRQGDDCSWDPVFDRVVEQLKMRVDR